MMAPAATLTFDALLYSYLFVARSTDGLRCKNEEGDACGHERYTSNLYRLARQDAEPEKVSRGGK